MDRYRKNPIAILIFTLPVLLLYSVVVVYPVLQTAYKSLFAWDGLNTPKFIFLNNYIRLFQDSDFYISLINGLIFALVLVFYQIGLGAILALILINKRIKGVRFFRNSFFIPVVLSVTVVCQLWLTIYNGHYGLLNQLFSIIGLDYEQDWLGNPDTAIWAVAAVNAWQNMGYHLILIYAAIKSIPDYYFEAASIDGASTVKAHWKVTIPLLAETFKFCFILAVTGGLKAFEHMFIMTGGGPGTSTFTLTIFMYRAAFRLNEYGYASASAAILVIECLIFTVLINRFMARERITY
ncbi:carbohydrate ABC transporter permease [Paenibacillus chungangensis]|uniref:Carbohydrate ABC transporter permease n=1 Tax=Paenibacillus chungangensis TaxID=696535 RepID=A0ABW3HLA4_9BACL